MPRVGRPSVAARQLLSGRVRAGIQSPGRVAAGDRLAVRDTLRGREKVLRGTEVLEVEGVVEIVLPLTLPIAAPELLQEGPDRPRQLITQVPGQRRYPRVRSLDPVVLRQEVDGAVVQHDHEPFRQLLVPRDVRVVVAGRTVHRIDARNARAGVVPLNASVHRHRRVEV